MEEILNKKKNTLLVKDDVGKAKPNTRDLPPDGFSFGKPDKKDPEGAGVGKHCSCRALVSNLLLRSNVQLEGA